MELFRAPGCKGQLTPGTSRLSSGAEFPPMTRLPAAATDIATGRHGILGASDVDTAILAGLQRCICEPSLAETRVQKPQDVTPQHAAHLRVHPRKCTQGRRDVFSICGLAVPNSRMHQSYIQAPVTRAVRVSRPPAIHAPLNHAMVIGVQVLRYMRSPMCQFAHNTRKVLSALAKLTANRSRPRGAKLGG